MSTVIDEVETFIQKLHGLDYIITQEATKISYSETLTLPVYPFFKIEKKHLSDRLAESIEEYQKNRDNEKRASYAQKCLTWINRAFTCGVIREGKGLAGKLAECKERNMQLEQDLEKLSEKYLELKGKYDVMYGRFKPLNENNRGNKQ